MTYLLNRFGALTSMLLLVFMSNSWYTWIPLHVYIHFIFMYLLTHARTDGRSWGQCYQRQYHHCYESTSRIKNKFSHQWFKPVGPFQLEESLTSALALSSSARALSLQYIPKVVDSFVCSSCLISSHLISFECYAVQSSRLESTFCSPTPVPHFLIFFLFAIVPPQLTSKRKRRTQFLHFWSKTTIVIVFGE